MNKFIFTSSILLLALFSGCSSPQIYTDRIEVQKEKTKLFWSRANNYILRYEATNWGYYNKQNFYIPTGYQFGFSNNHIIIAPFDKSREINQIAISKELGETINYINIFIVYNILDNNLSQIKRKSNIIKNYITTGKTIQKKETLLNKEEEIETKEDFILQKKIEKKLKEEKEKLKRAKANSKL